MDRPPLYGHHFLTFVFSSFASLPSCLNCAPTSRICHMILKNLICCGSWEGSMFPTQADYTWWRVLWSHHSMHSSSNEEVQSLWERWMGSLWLRQSGIGGWSPWGLRRPNQMCGWDSFTHLFVVFTYWEDMKPLAYVRTICKLFATYGSMWVHSHCIRRRSGPYTQPSVAMGSGGGGRSWIGHPGCIWEMWNHIL